jgi:uncharacterized protein
VTLVVDAGPLIAMVDETDPRADSVHRILTADHGDWVVPAYVAAEADHMIAQRIGPGAERAFLRDLASGIYEVQALTPEEHQLAVELDQDHPGMGLADLSVIVLAARYRTQRILTFDERDFRRVRPLDGDSFVLLPADLERG